MKSLFRKQIIGVDKTLLVKDAVKLMPEVSRRRFLSGGASLGALTLLTGCEVSDSYSAENLLTQMSKFNDKVQAAIFNPNALAPTYPASADQAPVPVQRLLHARRRAGDRGEGLGARSRRAGGEPEGLEARGPLRAAAGDADHPPHLR